MLTSIKWDYYFASFDGFVASSLSLASMEANVAQQSRRGSRPSERAAHM